VTMAIYSMRCLKSSLVACSISMALLIFSLVTDLPLFIDPFLLFNSKKRVYGELQDRMIGYLCFLRDGAVISIV
jgi:hypothetical protein